MAELNTACEATFKDGHKESFKSIEEASEKSGLTIATIKIRCNKKGCGGKDKTLFEWLDDHTRRHFQAKKSKNKGKDFEYEVIRNLKDVGYTGCVRSAGESKAADNNKLDIIDTLDELPVNIQCKHTQNLPNYFTIRDACTDTTKPFCLLWKKTAGESTISKGTVAVIPVELFYKLIAK